MKRILIFLVCLLAALPACAETYAIGPELPAVEIAVARVGEQAVDENGYSQPFIYQFTLTDLATGEALTPVYALSEADAAWGGIYEVADVNFDGYNDLVIATAIGASNAIYTFYLWDEAARTFVWYEGPLLWNYALYPEEDCVTSHGTSGWAGLLHEDRVYTWSADRKELILSRSSVWDTVHDEQFEEREGGFAMIETYDESTLRESYYDHMTGEITTVENPVSRYEEDEDFLSERLAAEDAFLGMPAEEYTYNDGTNG